MPDTEPVSIQASSRATDCELPCTNQGNFTTLVYVDGYPNCPVEFTVDYCVTFEIVNGQSRPVVNFGEIRMGTIHLNADPQCWDLFLDLKNVIINGSLLEQTDFLNTIYNAAYEQIEDDWFNELIGTVGPGLFDCDDPSSNNHFNIVATHFNSSCYQVCLFSNGTFERNTCGDGCCIRTTRYCIDPITGDVIEEDLTEYTGQQACENIPSGELGCAGASMPPIAVSPCVNLCE